MTEPAQPPRRNTRRCRRRQPMPSTKAICYPNALGVGRSIALALLDLSEEGARLSVAQPLPAGTEVELVLEGSYGKPARLPARVVWSRELPGGSFVAGFRFHKSLPYADLLKMTRS